MIVVDASVVQPLLLDIPEQSPPVRRHFATVRENLAAPHVVDLEVTNAIRQLAHQGIVDTRLAASALADLMSMRMERFAHNDLLPRVWSLANSLTAYDAAYLALAETLEVPLVTRDRALAISETTAQVVVID